MSKRYKIEANAIMPDQINAPFNTIILKEKDLLEKSSQHLKNDEFFASDDESSIFWQHIKKEGLKVFTALKTPKGQVNIGVFAILYTLISFVFFFAKSIFREPLVRGWRLNIVRRIALQESNSVPSFMPDKLVGYYLTGWVLIIMRGIYFLPMIFITFLSGTKMLTLLKEIFFYAMDVMTDVDHLSFSAFFLQKVLPQAGIEIIIQLVVLGLYAVFVWPIYRLIMIQYALKLTHSGGFLSRKIIKRSVIIFKKNASLIYGIYGFAVAVDVLVLYLGKAMGIFTFGLAYFILPVFHLVFRHWVKGYAYGMLGQKLIATGALTVDNSQSADPLLMDDFSQNT